MTTKWKKDNKFYYYLEQPHYNNKNLKNRDISFIILSQAKVMDKLRFREKMWYLSIAEFLKIKEKLREILL